MNLYTVVAIKDNRVEENAAFFKYEDAVSHSWNLIKDDLFFEEIGPDEEPYIPPTNPFEKESFAESSEGDARIEILSYTF